VRVNILWKGVMVVRVRVKLRVGDKEVITNALANSGFESEEPEVVLPLRVAEKLNLYPRLPNGTIVEEYVGVGGFKVQSFRISGILEVYAISNDKVKGPIRATAIIISGEDEVILSDRAIDGLGIILIRPGEGLWRFDDDPPSTIRRSKPREVW